jgi:hypothetical protein
VFDRGPLEPGETRVVARRWWALLLIPLAVGCASPRVVRLDTGNGRPVHHTPRTSGGSVEVDAEDFEKSLARLVLDVPLSFRPGVAHCREVLTQQLKELSSELLKPGSTLRRLVTKDRE